MIIYSEYQFRRPFAGKREGTDFEVPLLNNLEALRRPPPPRYRVTYTPYCTSRSSHAFAYMICVMIAAF